MGTYYQAYAEAKINGAWKGIDFYVFANGKYVPVEIVEGKSYVSSALAEKHLHWAIAASEMSPELQRDHPWYVEEEKKEEKWQGSLVSCVTGDDIAALKLDKPEHCGFVDKTLINAFEKEEGEIWEWLSAKEYAELPPEARIGYSWYEWSEPGGTQEVWTKIRDGLSERIDAYNNSRYSYPYDRIPPEITMSDTRVVIFMS